MLIGSYTWRFRLRAWWNRGLNIVFPAQIATCVLCQRPVHLDTRTAYPSDIGADAPADVCMFCLQDAGAQTGQVRPRTITVLRKPVRILPAMPYEGLARTAIRKWKYDGTVELTPWFARQIAYAVRQLQPDLPFDQIVPVPTSIDRYRKRGYHHVGLLAMAVGRQLGIASEELLTRATRSGSDTFTQSQTAKSAAQRRRSLQGLYRPLPSIQVSGKHLLLIDDVVTTGATVESCATALLMTGASRITCAAISLIESARSTSS